MKKLTSLLLTSTLLLAACQNTKEAEKKEEKPEAPKVNKDMMAITSQYKTFTIKEMDAFLKGTTEFTNAVKQGDTEKAKALYPKVRMHFERSEPVAEVFGDLDPKIDARLADLKEENKADSWSGYHKIEKALFKDKNLDGMDKVADQLLQDTKELRAKVETVDVTPKLMLQGSIDLLNEVSTTKITGEEEIYSHTDLYDFKANIEGAEKIYQLFKPLLDKKDKTLSSSIAKEFDNVNQLLKKYETEDGGYVSYTTLTKEETKLLGEAVNGLGEPLSKMAVVLT
ncbi:iron uptake system protein EfeO [Staphylococcus massiliensis]|uniref:Efem/EfeO family lipoprotein n=1 Tax=Staphylococcus massiliensis S46 TaxID=1229783 RepID=K9ANU6_9STAP|nr:iron uptake system protein EfeO [Staphylococcus massiliensis]EKU49068.1 lipoprotein [Staphylococcus massiliensis S46]MCG3400622.1 EfeM/EfeO family lipoprotein [Staphylococcus massiliensis]MCG3402392.1 EfeM/EfeO family lipoprotein [Staphylococcus massiliensis]PNZ99362.1 EfeM/EfeO family lipoprotein [Staphylococcus massiliensis CCUG 55927]